MTLAHKGAKINVNKPACRDAGEKNAVGKEQLFFRLGLLSHITRPP